jgi:hypothetical protein
VSVDMMNSSTTNTPSGYTQSNSLVTKFAFILVVLLVFIVLLQLGMRLLSWMLGPNGSPKLFTGMIPGNEMVAFDQDPTSTGSMPVIRSDNQRGGIEFTWSIWLFINSERDQSQYRHIFSKGNPEQYAKKYTSFTEVAPKTGIMYPNNAPGLYLAPNTNSLLLIMNSFNNVDEEIEIDNIPLNKWFNVMIRVKGNSLDIFMNGIITKSRQLATPPKQNYDKVFLHLNSGFSGYSSNLWYWNYTLGTSAITSLVDAGPDTTITSGPTLDLSSDYLSSKWYFAGEGDMFNPSS